ncbi:hypothetical protein SmJEL517_g00063 [Synchytrium microbalum]|uniref:Ubiquitin carboxyl-terminal hydrolase n=1 Tax=Synchytrium microbalum TaxID=1806994 RepID=A0A507CEJ5_9FUNG|nr:uncharacterized protein SmJEL517_g00063 [Synchytrium microbalum]TPX38052.1 hypothetical protein SmJEL517_g00063 [Synchytrium microbalum]
MNKKALVFGDLTQDEVDAVLQSDKLLEQFITGWSSDELHQLPKSTRKSKHKSTTENAHGSSRISKDAASSPFSPGHTAFGSPVLPRSSASTTTRSTPTTTRSTPIRHPQSLPDHQPVLDLVTVSQTAPSAAKTKPPLAADTNSIPRTTTLQPKPTVDVPSSAPTPPASSLAIPNNIAPATITPQPSSKPAWSSIASSRPQQPSISKPPVINNVSASSPASSSALSSPVLSHTIATPVSPTLSTTSSSSLHPTTTVEQVQSKTDTSSSIISYSSIASTASSAANRQHLANGRIPNGVLTPHQLQQRQLNSNALKPPLPSTPLPNVVTTSMMTPPPSSSPQQNPQNSSVSSTSSSPTPAPESITSPAATPATTENGNGSLLSSTTTTPSQKSTSPVVLSPKTSPISWAGVAKIGVGPGTEKGVGAVGHVSKPGARKQSFYEKPSDLLKHFEPSLDCPLIIPRGLVNNGNMCFMNAILQPLVYCPPFYNLMKMVGKRVSHSFSRRTPLTEAVIMFLNEFDIEDETQRIPPEADPSTPFAPEYVYDALKSLKKINSTKGRQEDAEEFLGFILDGVHEELLEVMHEGDPSALAARNSTNSNGSQMAGKEAMPESNDWTEVGKGNKTLVTRRTEISTSPITKIFVGRMRSTIRHPGSRDSVTDEPFMFLHLDINPDSVSTIDDALRNVAVPEVLDEFTSPTKGTKVEATKQNLLDTFPPILLLHLKRFVYTHTGGTQKIHKHVAYSTELDVLADIISPTTRATISAVKYQLFAVVYHHGKLAAGGHYTCDVLRAPNQWLNIDDALVQKVHVSEVLREKRDRDVYMLMFRKI